MPKYSIADGNDFGQPTAGRKDGDSLPKLLLAEQNMIALYIWQVHLLKLTGAQSACKGHAIRTGWSMLASMIGSSGSGL